MACADASESMSIAESTPTATTANLHRVFIAELRVVAASSSPAVPQGTADCRNATGTPTVVVRRSGSRAPDGELELCSRSTAV